MRIAYKSLVFSLRFTQSYFLRLYGYLFRSEREDFAIIPVVARPSDRGNRKHEVAVAKYLPCQFIEERSIEWILMCSLLLCGQ